MPEILLLALDQFEFLPVVFGTLKQVVLRFQHRTRDCIQTRHNQVVIGRHEDILSGTPRPAPGTSPDTGRSKGLAAALPALCCSREGPAHAAIFSSGSPRATWHPTPFNRLSVN